MSQTQSERPVLVTGFGPFGHHLVNASWEAVKELEKLGVKHKSKPVSLQTKEVPVIYNVISSTIPSLLADVNPRLCIHVGVSPYSVMKIERCGKNSRYYKPDVCGAVPVDECCVTGGPPIISTRFDVDKVCSKLNEKQDSVTVQISDDAGRYLCDYIYYTSLHSEKYPVVFVHVPELGKPYTASELGHALRFLIEILLEELDYM